MTEQTRLRIIGGVFLVSAAVIVLPMLFDGRGVESPPAPSMAVTPTIDVPHVAALDPAKLAPADALRKRIDGDGFERSTATRVGDPVLTPADRRDKGALPPAWGVQLGSFSDRAKAVALRDQLRADGYQSVLTDVKGITGVATRVAVGPMIERDEAARLERELEKRYGMDAIIVVFGQ